MNTTDVIAAIGLGITAVAAAIAAYTIFDARRTATKQKDLETLLQLSNLLTEWHDSLLDVLEPHDRYWRQRIDKFEARRKFQGPLYVYFALLGADKKFAEVIKRAKCFEWKALEEKGLVVDESGKRIEPPEGCLTINRITLSEQTLTEAYQYAVDAIRNIAAKEV